jgi:2-(1,2-epoxy-1,2-dihydrophenyl)acetyl-CoA isomerase
MKGGTAMPENDLSVEETEGWLVVRFDRPQVRNALRAKTWTELDAALDRGESGEVAGLILTGGDQWFCSGADLGEARGASTLPGEASLWPATSRLRQAQRTIERLRAFPKPTIAAVEGYAIGVGWSVMLACDLIVASAAAFFAQPAPAAGMVPDGGLVRDLCRAIGYHATADMLLCSTRMEAADALRHGMLSRLSEPGHTLADSLELARSISAIPASVRFVLKSLLVSVLTGGDAAFLEHEAMAVSFGKLQPAHADGRASFRAGSRFYGA